MIVSVTETVKTRGHGDCIDLTDAVERAVRQSGIRQGLATVAVIGSTAGITTIEYEPGVEPHGQSPWHQNPAPRGATSRPRVA